MSRITVTDERGDTRNAVVSNNMLALAAGTVAGIAERHAITAGRLAATDPVQAERELAWAHQVAELACTLGPSDACTASMRLNLALAARALARAA